MLLFLVLLLIGSYTWFPLETEAANILCLVGTARHHNPGWTQPLFEALAQRRHSLTVLSTAPVPKKKIKGITVFSLPNEYDVVKEYFVSGTGAYNSVSTVKLIMVQHAAPLISCRAVMESPMLAKMRAQLTDEVADQDLIISDATNEMECLLPLVPNHRSIPIVGVSGGKLTSELLELVGAEDTINVATIPHPMSELPENMDFVARIRNSILYMFDNLFRLPDDIPKSSGALVRKNHVYPNHLKVMLLNTHSTLDYAQNLPGSVIEVGGLHIWPQSRRLPANIQKFANKFKDGVVYINLSHIDLLFGIGTEAVLHMAGRQPTYGFIWNVENTKELPVKLDNVLTLHVDARLQQDILAQSKVKCFLNHGDSFSLQEAIHNAVPVLVIPLILEQFNNAQRIEERNLGVVLPTNVFSTFSMAKALEGVLNNKTIPEAVSKAQVKFRTRPMPPLEKAVWYVEHLITEPELYSDFVKPSLSFFVSHSLDTLAIPTVALPALVILIILAHLFLSVPPQLKYDNDKEEDIADDGNVAMAVGDTLNESKKRTGKEVDNQIPSSEGDPPMAKLLKTLPDTKID